MMRSVRQKNGEAGNALVEFALASVIILTVLFGIIDMGRALFAYDWVSNAARIATRYAMVRGTSCSTLLPGCNVGPPQGAYQSDVVAYLNTQAIGIDPSKLTVTAWCDAGSSAFQPLPCTSPQGVNVKVQYQFSFVSPFIRHTWTMSSASVRVVSQ
jgi:Flp pilus assembly protein TadG